MTSERIEQIVNGSVLVENKKPEQRELINIYDMVNLLDDQNGFYLSQHMEYDRPDGLKTYMVYCIDDPKTYKIGDHVLLSFNYRSRNKQIQKSFDQKRLEGSHAITAWIMSRPQTQSLGPTAPLAIPHACIGTCGIIVGVDQKKKKTVVKALISTERKSGVYYFIIKKLDKKDVMSYFELRVSKAS